MAENNKSKGVVRFFSWLDFWKKVDCRLEQELNYSEGLKTSKPEHAKNWPIKIKGQDVGSNDGYEMMGMINQFLYFGH